MGEFPKCTVLDEFLAQAQDGIEVVDSCGNVIWANPAFFTITGMRPEERLGRNIFEVNPHGGLATVLRTGKPLTGVKVRSPSMDREVVGNIAPIWRDGILVGALLLARDISDIVNLARKLAEERKEVAESLYSTFARPRYSFDDILGTSPAIKETLTLAREAARAPTPVLLQGETGVGKELFAHAIHATSPRSNGPFIAVNCAALPPNLLETELFGHERGAFTGATSRHRGAFALADGGTVFLDEIGEIHPEAQAKLLRVLESGEIKPLGAEASTRVDVRVIAATNRNLEEMARRGTFRSDLLFRLDVVRIRIPPLRERRADIPLLATCFLRGFTSRLGLEAKELNPEALQLLAQYDWPGNVRELENVLQYAVLTCRSRVITRAHIAAKLPTTLDPEARPQRTLNLRQLEEEAVIQALKTYGSTVEGKRRAAAALGISLGTLYNKLRKYSSREAGQRRTACPFFPEP